MTGSLLHILPAVVNIRPYTPTDLNACLALFDSNRPPYFHPSERADYEAFLSDPADRGEYFVMERGTEVLAYGGIWAGTEGVGGLSWGMVRGDSHGQGLGTQLTVDRLDRLRRRPELRGVRLDTSQHTEVFYARHGFVVVGRTPGGFAPGLDEVKMLLDLT
ncbi:GNAT family N-acetyltransferase [Deinococcus radiomollis]|uniref:GNAT family N-acetyltransferase n=1 Tax=Deinococcus radiomollis TaxID=468916 RepID=UPI003891ED19